MGTWLKELENIIIILYSERGTKGLVRDEISGKGGQSVYILLCIPVVLAKVHRDVSLIWVSMGAWRFSGAVVAVYGDTCFERCSSRV